MSVGNGKSRHQPTALSMVICAIYPVHDISSEYSVEETELPQASEHTQTNACKSFTHTHLWWRWRWSRRQCRWETRNAHARTLSSCTSSLYIFIYIYIAYAQQNMKRHKIVQNEATNKTCIAWSSLALQIKNSGKCRPRKDESPNHTDRYAHVRLRFRTTLNVSRSPCVWRIKKQGHQVCTLCTLHHKTGANVHSHKKKL